MSRVTIKLEVDDADMNRLVDVLERIAMALERREEDYENATGLDDDLAEYLMDNGFPDEPVRERDEPDL